LRQNAEIDAQRLMSIIIAKRVPRKRSCRRAKKTAKRRAHRAKSKTEGEKVRR
jgi:hypothetical protein